MCLAWMSLAIARLAQSLSTTTVQGTVFLANGSPGSGTIQINWPAFTTASNQTVAAGKMTANIGADGFVSVNLAANLGSSPAGLYDTVVYHMSDGTTSTEYWATETAVASPIWSAAWSAMSRTGSAPKASLRRSALCLPSSRSPSKPGIGTKAPRRRRPVAWDHNVGPRCTHL